jgi:hypothetical protein
MTREEYKRRQDEIISRMSSADPRQAQEEVEALTREYMRANPRALP